MSAELEKLKCVEIELIEKSQENMEILQLNTDLESKVVRSVNDCSLFYSPDIATFHRDLSFLVLALRSLFLL